MKNGTMHDEDSWMTAFSSRVKNRVVSGQNSRMNIVVQSIPMMLCVVRAIYPVRYTRSVKSMAEIGFIISACHMYPPGFGSRWSVASMTKKTRMYVSRRYVCCLLLFVMCGFVMCMNCCFVFMALAYVFTNVMIIIL